MYLNDGIPQTFCGHFIALILSLFLPIDSLPAGQTDGQPNPIVLHIDSNRKMNFGGEMT